MPAPAIRIFDAPRCHLGEGPCYVPATDTAWWVDILERRLFEAPFAGGAVQVHTLPLLVSDVSVIDDDRHLLAAEDGLYIRSVADGRLTRYCSLEAEDARTRSNDGRVHPSGAYWISTMGREAEVGLGTIYHVMGTRVTQLYGGLTIPNAIAFSPDGATGYFACTEDGRLKRVALDPVTGELCGILGDGGGQAAR
ncbi:SMP-30/gluconolactonase/LRE family protein [Methylobacterium sp. BTF04]|nr:SMP-30/gluconolactonase/LRE family protein [Methylobacterium sp. BTF04]